MCLLVRSGFQSRPLFVQWRAHYIPGVNKFNISNMKLSTGHQIHP